jgi:hypothetical protein
VCVWLAHLYSISVALAALPAAHARPAQATGILRHADTTRGWHMPLRVEKEVAQEDCVCVCVITHSQTLSQSHLPLY